MLELSFMQYVPSISQLVGAFIGLNVLYFSGVVVYNIFFHPLRNYPGPLLAKATPFYLAIINILGRKHLATEKWHAKYGEVVRVAPDQLYFIGENAWRDIYMHKQGRPQLQKANRQRAMNGTYSIISAPDDVHARQRKMLSHAFSDRALREQEPLLNTYINLLMSNLSDDAKKGRQVDIVSNFNFTTFDIIGDLSFAESFHNLELRRPHPWLSIVFDTVRIFAFIGTLSIIPGARAFLNAFSKTLTPKRERMHRYTRDRVSKRIEDGDSERPDFMSKVLPHLTEDGTGISREEVNLTTMVLIVAGSETTATLLSGCVYLLLRHPEAMSKLKEEVRTSFENATEIDLLKVNHLTYLHAVLEESFRLYPPVPVSMPRITLPEGTSICGHWVPGNMVVGVPQRAAYRWPSNFVDSTSFIPERWLPDRDPKFEKDRRGVLQPFSTGPRNCLGKNLAYAEMKLILARLIFQFDFEMVDKEFEWDNQRVYTLYEKPPLMLWIRERTA